MLLQSKMAAGAGAAWLAVNDPLLAGTLPAPILLCHLGSRHVSKMLRSSRV